MLPHEHAATCTVVEQAIASHRIASGKPLFALDGTGRGQAKQLWEAPVACIIVAGSESTCLYANLLASEAHGAMSFTELIRAPSALPSALPGNKVFESNYRKKVTHGAHEMTMHGATRWAVALDGSPSAGGTSAVAYAFTRWLREDGTLHGPRGYTLAPPLTAEARSAVEAAVEAAVLEVRRLKGEEGRGNKDPGVLSAVAEMKQYREQLLMDAQNIAARDQLGVQRAP